jgi:hypothetical protein
LAEGRQLLLSSFPVDVPVFPVNYDNCHLMNARNEELCKRATAHEFEEGTVRGAFAASTGHDAYGRVRGATPVDVQMEGI